MALKPIHLDVPDSAKKRTARGGRFNALLPVLTAHRSA